MQLPKYSSKCKKRKINKICLVPGCNAPYTGVAQQKYCEFHMNPRHRMRKKRDNSVVGNNIVFKHAFTDCPTIWRPCDTCEDDYSFTAFPRQYVYPGHCEKHRNPQQRLHHERMKRLEVLK